MSRESLFGLTVGLMVVLGAFIVYRRCYESGVMRNALYYGTWIMRMRYGLLLCAAPAILGIVAFLNGHMLEALLLVRNESAFVDIFAITLISYFAVGVGLVQCRIVELHGDSRFGPIKSLSDPPVVPGGPPMPSWSAKKMLLWWCLGAIFPAFVCYTTIQNHTDTPTGWATIGKLLIGVLTGWCAANVITLLIACLESWLLGDLDHLARVGVIPFEIYAQKFSPHQNPDRPGTVRGVIRWLFGDSRHGFSWLLRGPGYTDANGNLLPGHPQALILTAFCAITYFAGYFWGLGNTDWAHLTWTTGFCGLLLLFVLGNFMTSLAFWLDYYGLPPIVFAVLYTLIVFDFNVSDHYFDLRVPPISASLDAQAKPRGSKNGYVEAATTPRDKTEPTTDEASAKNYDGYEQLYLANVLQDWPFPDIKGKKTLVVVTASGGGIQAAAWTTKVLTELDREFKGLSQSIGLMSAVSGGSVGTMFYLGRRPLPDRNFGATPIHMIPDEADWMAIREPSMESALEAVAWGLVSPDFVRAVLPPGAPPMIDRGWALESLWWNKMGRNRDDRKLMSELTIRDLIPLIRQHRLPPVIFNATCVETGQRVSISPIHVAVSPPKPWNKNRENDWRPERERIVQDPKHHEAELVSTPIDFLDFYNAALADEQGNRDLTLEQSDNGRLVKWADANVRVSTAVRLSATFSYVTPVARPDPLQGFGPIATVQRLVGWAKGVTNKLEHRRQRLNRHFCDGGYADNPGLVTAVRSIRDLLEYYRREKKIPPFQQVLVIRIEPFPKTAAEYAKDNTGYLSAVYGPSAALSAMRVSTQAERGELELGLLEGARYLNRDATRLYKNALESIQSIVEKKPAADDSNSILGNLWKQAEASTLSSLTSLYDQSKSPFLPDISTIEKKIADMAGVSIPQEYQAEWNDALQKFKDAKASMITGLDQLADPYFVPVDSVTFRFEVYPSDDKCCTDIPDDEEPIEPPLTWTLTERQKRDLDRAWKRIRCPSHWEQYYRGTADTISPVRIGELFPADSKYVNNDNCDDPPKK